MRYVSAAAWSDPQSVAVVTDASLPSETADWQSLLDESIPLMVPPHSRRQVVLDLEQYVCAYPQVRLSGGGGSRVTIGWAEALHLDRSGQAKGQRDGVEGRAFIALCHDIILPDGGEARQFEPLWWRAGCFVELLVETADQPVTLEGLGLLETRFPLVMESRFSSSDPRLEAVAPLALRGLQRCAHETYMDCPYWITRLLNDRCIQDSAFHQSHDSSGDEALGYGLNAEHRIQCHGRLRIQTLDAEPRPGLA